MGKLIDLKGKRFGRLYVCCRSGKSSKNGVYWICKCDCGRGVSVLSCNLLRGVTQSCGCLRSENAKLRLQEGKSKRIIIFSNQNFVYLQNDIQLY